MAPSAHYCVIIYRKFIGVRIKPWKKVTMVINRNSPNAYLYVYIKHSYCCEVCEDDLCCPSVFKTKARRKRGLTLISSNYLWNETRVISLRRLRFFEIIMTLKHGNIGLLCDELLFINKRWIKFLIVTLPVHICQMFDDSKKSC